MRKLRDKIRALGERLPKKHGDWYRVRVYDNHYLVLDTWNGYIYHYPNGAESTGTDNMYRVVYTFEDVNGKPNNFQIVKPHMEGFWYCHLPSLINKNTLTDATVS